MDALKNRKFEFMDEKIIVCGRILHRIRAIQDFSDVKTGDFGGFIEKETNLSHEGKAWISDNACVYDNARVYDDAHVYGNARISDNAKICGNARVFGNARVSDGVYVSDDARVYGNTCICGITSVCGTGVFYSEWL